VARARFQAGPTIMYDLTTSVNVFGGSTMLAQHTQSSGLLGGRPVALELSARQLDRSGSWQGQLQTSAEDAFMYTVLKHLSHYRRFRRIHSTD